jgi:hypothetical protein
VIKAVAKAAVIGAVVAGITLAAWTYYDVSVNRKDMFGYASVYLAGALGAGIGGLVAALIGFVVEGMRRARQP